MEFLQRKPGKDPLTWGLEYLYGVRRLALEPDMIDLVYDLDQRVPVCLWINDQIDAINTQLNLHLQSCHDCFHSWEQCQIQIFAAPLAQSFGLDGVCNLQTNPMTILVDVGRVVPQDWLLLVIHEYAHAHAGLPGHHEQFARSLTHLCLGMGIPVPSWQPDREQEFRSYPYCTPTRDPLAFWRGEGGDWRSSVTNSYILPESISEST